MPASGMPATHQKVPSNTRWSSSDRAAARFPGKCGQSLLRSRLQSGPCYPLRTRAGGLQQGTRTDVRRHMSLPHPAPLDPGSPRHRVRGLGTGRAQHREQGAQGARPSPVWRTWSHRGSHRPSSLVSRWECGWEGSSSYSCRELQRLGEEQRCAPNKMALTLLLRLPQARSSGLLPAWNNLASGACEAGRCFPQA